MKLSLFNFLLLCIQLITRSHAYCKPSLAFAIKVTKAENNGNTKQLYSYNPYNNDDQGKPLKILGGLIFLGAGLFGSDIASSLGKLTTNVLTEQRATESNGQLKSSSSSRGSLTRLTRREITAKLQQVPVFFVCASNGIGNDNNEGIYISEEGIGSLFMEKADADKYLASTNKNSLKVSAATLDQVYFPLLQKKAKVGSFIQGVAGKSDPSATYKLVASPLQINQVASEWKQSHDSNSGDIPLFRISNLAFSKAEGVEIPFFVRKEDALNAYQRLAEDKKSSNVELKAPELQVSSLNDMVKIFETGGFEGRAIEFYPSIDAIETASRIILGPY